MMHSAYNVKFEALLYDVLINVTHAADFSETLVSVYQTTWRHLSEYRISDTALKTCILQVWSSHITFALVQFTSQKTVILMVPLKHKSLSVMFNFT